MKTKSDDKSNEEREIRNITLALPRRLLRRVKVLAAEQDTSVSRLLAEFLEEIVKRDEAYEKAYAGWREEMKNLRDLGLHGKIPWSREELHERR